jgi:hypothetical protein
MSHCDDNNYGESAEYCCDGCGGCGAQLLVVVVVVVVAVLIFWLQPFVRVKFVSALNNTSGW